jgi:hypothetical protein
MRSSVALVMVYCLLAAASVAQRAAPIAPAAAGDGVLRIFAPGNPAALATPDPRARLAVSADGNYNDADDWGGTPLTLAIIHHAGWNRRLVHHDFNSKQDSDRRHERYMAQATLEGVARFGFDRARFFNTQEDPEGAVRNLAAEVNASSARSPLVILLAGATEVIWQAINRADPERRKYVHVISHGDFERGSNNDMKRRWGHSARDVIDLGVNWVQISDQNKDKKVAATGFATGTMTAWQFLKRFPHGEWVYDWIDRVDSDEGVGRWGYRGATGDASDAGLAYYFFTGDQDGNVAKLEHFLAGPVTKTLLATADQPATALYFPPPGEGLEVQSRRTPVNSGLDPALIDELRKRKVDRWALWRHGHLVHVEGEWNVVRNVASLRKTWHALTVGAAIAQGKIASYHETLNRWETDLVGHDALVTWWHVITQSTAFDYPYADQPDYRPGEIWTYSDKNPVRLCNALAKIYGKRSYHDGYEDVLRAAYFDAIGMRGWKIGFTKPDDGVRLFLDLEDMGRLGLLVLARGEWKGVQLIPQRFVEELETKQTRGMRVNYKGPDDGNVALDPKQFPEVPYGYMTWTNTDRDFFPGADDAWAWGSGAGGHVIFWNRNNGIVYAAQGLDRDAGGTARGIPHVIEEGIRHAAAPRH